LLRPAIGGASTTVFLATSASGMFLIAHAASSSQALGLEASGAGKLEAGGLTGIQLKPMSLGETGTE